MRAQVRSIREAIIEATAAIAATPSTSPRLDAELLLGHVLGMDRTHLLSEFDRMLMPDQLRVYGTLIEQRLTGTPIAYLTGRRDFLDLTLQVGPGALVPRPETEILVEWAIAHIRDRALSAEHLVVDVGAGTGAIAVAIADKFRTAGPRIVASDSAPGALAWCRRNRAQHGLESRTHLVLGDLLLWLGAPASLVLANLPYLRPDQVTGTWELASEPSEALIGGPDGLDQIRRLVADAPRFLTRRGAIALEIDPDQVHSVAALLIEHLGDIQVEIIPDLAGFDRFVVGYRNEGR